MFHHGKTKCSRTTKRPLAQRIVAFMLSLMMLLMILDPLWECCDHLDNLRHLGGAHGVLLILLVVACAGISLLKSFSFLPPNFMSAILRGAIPYSPALCGFDGFARFARANSQDTAVLPLRV